MVDLLGRLLLPRAMEPGERQRKEMQVGCGWPSKPPVAMNAGAPVGLSCRVRCSAQQGRGSQGLTGELAAFCSRLAAGVGAGGIMRMGQPWSPCLPSSSCSSAASRWAQRCTGQRHRSAVFAADKHSSSTVEPSGAQRQHQVQPPSSRYTPLHNNITDFVARIALTPEEIKYRHQVIELCVFSHVHAFHAFCSVCLVLCLFSVAACERLTTSRGIVSPPYCTEQTYLETLGWGRPFPLSPNNAALNNARLVETL